MATAGLWMLGAVAILMITSGLPVWLVLISVAMGFGGLGIYLGEFTISFLSVLPSRFLGLAENDLLQALPLYVFMGTLLNHLPLADILFRGGNRALARTGAGAPLAGLGLGMLLAPMNGSVGSSVTMLSRTMQPRLDASGVPLPRAAALVCVASTLGVVVPPSLVLILLGEAMLRAHTEATNVTGLIGRIVNTQDVFRGALIPAAILLVLCLVIAWRSNRKSGPIESPPQLPLTEKLTAIITVLAILTLLGSVTLGRMYAVEAAATGGIILLCYGLVSGYLTRKVLGEVLRNTMALSGALFALLIAATTFTLILRAYGTDRWIAAALNGMGGGANQRLLLVIVILMLCAFVLDAFEMIFVVIPVIMPPLLMVFPDATRVSVLTLLVLQTSFLVPPLGYAILMVRQQQTHPLRVRELVTALVPYLVAQLFVVILVVIFPQLILRVE